MKTAGAVKLLSFILGTLCFISFMLGVIDAKRVSNNKWPLFCFNEVNYDDGGTWRFTGPGYQVIYWHAIGFEPNKDSELIANYIYVGTELKWGPWMSTELPEAPRYKLQKYTHDDPNIPCLP